MSAEAVATFLGPKVKGHVLFYQHKNGTVVSTDFTTLPPGKHGFHIHKAGDLRGEGCKLACDHYHKGRPTKHGGPPSMGGQRHTGDLGNIELPKNGEALKIEHFLKNVDVKDLWGRSLIVHADPDDLGLGKHDDSHTTGHSGARIACAVIGRVLETCQPKPVEAMKDMKGGARDVSAFDPFDSLWSPVSQTRKNTRR